MRESFNLMAAMNSLMVERFNVAGAHVAKLFGRPQDENKEFEEKAARVSAIGVKTAIYGRLFFTALMLMSSLFSRPPSLTVGVACSPSSTGLTSARSWPSSPIWVASTVP